MKVVRVAAAAILNERGEVLLAKRPADKHMGGLWEFPGGKVEPDESVQDALARELYEEVGIEVQQSEALIEISHRYADKAVYLHVYLVRKFGGQAHGKEGQALQWCAKSDLSRYTFPDANRSIVTALQLSSQCAISSQASTYEALQLQRDSARSLSIKRFHLRAPWLQASEYARYWMRLWEQKKDEEFLVLHDSRPEVWRALEDYNADVHLSSSFAATLNSRPVASHVKLGISCHSLEELSQAEQLQADYVFYSPILPTASHPQQPGLGWDALRGFCQRATVPVYALGGMTPSMWEQARECGAQGVAGISAFTSAKHTQK